jgi:hypothetical protein
MNSATAGRLSASSSPGVTRSERGKKQLLPERIAVLSAHTVVLFEDKTLLRELPTLRCCWAKRGEHVVVPIMANDARRSVFGVLNPEPAIASFSFGTATEARTSACSRTRCAPATNAGPSADLGLGQQSHGQDHAPGAKALRMELAWLPTTGPELSPTERLWQSGRRT